VREPGVRVAGLFTFREVRRFIGASGAWSLAIFLAGIYLLGSLIEGGMAGIAHFTGGYTITIFTSSGTGQGWWNYPYVYAVAPWGYLEIPFFTGISMLLVAVGVGLGMAVAVLLVLQLLRPSPAGAARSKAVGAATGLTPAMIGLVTLGACCSTTAAASAGVGLVAQASGTSISNLLLNDWYLGVFQIVIVWAALLAQELLLTVYGGLYGRDAGRRTTTRTAPASRGLRYVAGIGLRVVLVAGGLLWALAMLAEWTTVSTSSAGVGEWFQWLVQHLLLAGLAVGAGFFPGATLRLLERTRRGVLRVVPALALIGGISLLVWLPPILVSAGLDSLANQILGALGAPISWGVISPGPVGGPALLARWAIEYVVVAGFAIAVSLLPRRVLDPLVATVARVTVSPGPAPVVLDPQPIPRNEDRGDPHPSTPSALGEP